MKQIDVLIKTNKVVGKGFFEMELKDPYLARASKPGQFIEVRCLDSHMPLLRRPFSVHGISKNTIKILYEVVGPATCILSTKKSGEYVNVIGPLGNGFDVTYKREGAIIVAGGIGVAPMVALAERLKNKKNSFILIGAKTKSHLLCEKKFKSLGFKVATITEDGVKSKRGFVTNLLHNLLEVDEGIGYEIFACGPNGMLKAVWDIAGENNIPCQFSFESMMACGVGVCLGCPIKVRKGLIDTEYKMVCKDGPVFDAQDVVWDGK